jgi:hypothetical protein
LLILRKSEVAFTVATKSFVFKPQFVKKLILIASMYLVFPFVVQSQDRVGIGTIMPASKLDVAGTTTTQGFKMPTGAVSGYVLTSDANGLATWQIAQSAQYVQYGSQPSTIAPGQPFTYSTAVLTSPGIIASTGIFPPFFQSGTIFTLAETGRYEVNYQMTYPTDAGVVLFMGQTNFTMLPLNYSMIGKSTNGAVSGSVIIETSIANSLLSVNAAPGNVVAISIPPNSSTINQGATTISIKKLN